MVHAVHHRCVLSLLEVEANAVLDWRVKKAQECLKRLGYSSFSSIPFACSAVISTAASGLSALMSVGLLDRAAGVSWLCCIVEQLQGKRRQQS